MRRIKVINEPTDMVPLLRCVDTETKFKVFIELCSDWKTADEIISKHGEMGRDALSFLEKSKLVETRWQPSNEKGSPPVKAYHTYYTSFHISTTLSLEEMAEILSVVMMPEDAFKKIESKIHDLVGDEGAFSGNIEEKLNLSPLTLRAIIKRSSKLEYRGQRIERFKP